MEVQVRVCEALEEAEVTSERACMGWLPGGGGQCPAGRERAMTVL